MPLAGFVAAWPIFTEALAFGTCPVGGSTGTPEFASFFFGMVNDVPVAGPEGSRVDARALPVLALAFAVSSGDVAALLRSGFLTAPAGRSNVSA